MNATAAGPTAALRPDRADLRHRYDAVRAASEALCEPLAPDDYVVQTMPDVSPTKWHLAHTTWFFETLALLPHAAGYRPAHAQYQYLFNSYYNTLGKQYCRPDRGFLVRPTTEEVFGYRHAVDEAMAALLDGADEMTLTAVAPIVEVGIHHEQQHQELLVTDIKHVFASNPIVPEYRPRTAADDGGCPVPPLAWRAYPEAVREIGHGGPGFRYDNETPRHRVFAPAFALASRLVTAGEYREFMADGGYERADLWLSDGWNEVQSRGWKAPLYWGEKDGEWWMATLAGERPVDPAEPVCHVSFYEADAYARWKDARLPTEAEWETVAAECETDAVERGNFVEDGRFHPAAVREKAPATVQLLGDVWEWTASPYVAYPGYRAPEGALGEYNAKFMCNQMILRGGSCATPRSHIRATYRNFFPPSARWQFSGIRLALDAEAAR